MRLGAARKNVIFGYANFVIAAIISILTTPVLVGYLGSNTFGTWKALQRIVEVASALDGKPYQALKSLLASASINDKSEEKSRIIGSSIAVWLVWFPVVLLFISTAVATLDFTILDTTLVGSFQVKMAAVALGINAILLTIFNIPGAVLVAVNRGYIVHLATTCSLIAVNVGIVVALHSGYGLVAMSFITCVGTLLLGLITVLALRSRVEWWWPKRPNGREILNFGRYGAWINGWMVVATLLFATEPLMLAAFAGSNSVTVYSLSAFSTQFAASITLMTASALVPTIGASLASRRPDEAAKLIRMTRELVLTVATAAAILILIGNKLFVTLWVGPEHYIGDSGNLMITLSFIQIALIRCEAQILESALSIRRVVIFGLISSLISAIAGSIAYLVVGSIIGMLFGFILGRSILSIILPRLTNEINYLKLKFPTRSLAASAICLASAFAISKYLSNADNLILTFAFAVLITIFAMSIVPSYDTIKQIIGRGNYS